MDGSKFHTQTGEHINLKPWAWGARVVAVLLIAIGILAASIVPDLPRVAG